jgi:hypothetical protein
MELRKWESHLKGFIGFFSEKANLKARIRDYLW